MHTVLFPSYLKVKEIQEKRENSTPTTTVTPVLLVYSHVD